MQLCVKASVQKRGREASESCNTMELMEKAFKQSDLMEKRNICKSDDSLMTVSGVVAAEINLPQFRTSTAILLRMTSGNAAILQLCFTCISKILRFAHVCAGNLTGNSG